MKILLSWLKEYVDIDVTPKELETKLFSCGFEVEELIEVGKDVTNVVVGYVKECEPIPETHLSLCKVDAGKHGEFQICCGADNVKAGGKFPLALIGATVYATAKDHVTIEGVMEIQQGKLRGYDSFGMLCSGTELGLNEDLYPGAGYNGLLVLPEDAEIGADVKPILGMDDYIFDISITANRPDCQSVVGIAREVAAILNKEFKAPDMTYTEDGTTNPDISVEVIDQDICPRYLSHYVYDIQYMESPAWMKRRLRLTGMNCINAVVDITNYVLLEIGQPMHAFDLSTLEGSSIVVRRAKEGEELTTLDEKLRVLNPNNLLICDKVKAVGLAGVMGGLNSEITENTKSILFESAKFRKDNVRKTSRGLGLHSDAAARYEKGIDEYSAECGMARALHLMQELGVGKVSSTHFDVSAGESTEKRVITVETAKVNYVLGIEVPEEEMVRILKALAFEVELKDGVMTLAIPRYREDIENYQDIAEEVIREYGYDKVVPTFLNEAFVTNGGLSAAQSKELEVKKFLCTQGFYEIQTIAMVAKEEFDQFLIPEDDYRRNVIELLNPITENLSVMRTFLAPCMVRALEGNIKNGHSDLRFFEIANVYLPKALPLVEPPVENKTLVLGACGEDEDFFSLKEAIENLAADNDLTFRYDRATLPYLHPGRTAVISCNGVEIGTMGQLRYEIVDSLNITKEKKAGLKIFIAEINYDKLKEQFKDAIKYVPDNGYTTDNRDISVIVDGKVDCGSLIDTIYAADSLVKEVEMFDLFRSEKIGLGNKSMAFNIKFASEESDVTPEMSEESFQKVAEALKVKYNALLRA